MAQIRAMFIGTGAGALPEDRIVNTFHFNSPASFNDHYIQVSAAIVDFYTGVGTAPDVQYFAMGSYISPWVQRAAEVRLYDMSLPPKERPPHIFLCNLPEATSAGGLPEEVALCMSFKGNPPNNARRRGRIYLGPLVANVDTEASVTQPSRPSSNLIRDTNLAMRRLCDVGGATVGWSIFSSKPTDNYVPVAQGWTDNAWDTQRRRGPDADQRTPWYGFGAL